jgi:3-phytase
MSKTIFFFFLGLSLLSCNEKTSVKGPLTHEDKEAREDSLELVEAYRQQESISPEVVAFAETKPISADNMDDAADDPAVWYNEKNPSASLIYGSNKKGGLAVYNLEGAETDYYPIGNVNNVDIIKAGILDDTTVEVYLGCSNRSTQGINIFRVDSLGKLTDLIPGSFQVDSSKIDDIYGFCFGQSIDGKKSYAIINGKNGHMQQFEMMLSDKDLQLKLVREIKFDDQTEGMVVDRQTQSLYVGEENTGIWQLSLNPDSDSKTLLEQSTDSNPNISYDIEGLTIYRNTDVALLIASSQGNFSYAAFDLANDHEYIGSFKIIDGNVCDGVQETDGIEAIAADFGTGLEKGIFVAQDGFNYDGDSLMSQNFKMVNMQEILLQLENASN